MKMCLLQVWKGNLYQSKPANISSPQCYSVLSDILVKMSYAFRWKGDQMFYLLVKVSFAYLLPVSLNPLCFSVLSTKRQFPSVL